MGSSAMSSFGSQASAIAMATRWRWPPEISCGKARAIRPGSGSRTSFERPVDGLAQLLPLAGRCGGRAAPRSGGPAASAGPARSAAPGRRRPRPVRVRRSAASRRRPTICVPGEFDAAGRGHAVGQQSDDRERRQGLAGAGLADEAERVHRRPTVKDRSSTSVRPSAVADGESAYVEDESRAPPPGGRVEVSRRPSARRFTPMTSSDEQRCRGRSRRRAPCDGALGLLQHAAPGRVGRRRCRDRGRTGSASASTARPNCSARLTTRVGQMLGSTWLRTMRGQEVPGVRAAVM